MSEPARLVALVERLDPDRKAEVDAMFDRVAMELVPFDQGQQIAGLLRRSLATPVDSRASADAAWLRFVDLLNEELFESRALTEPESEALMVIVFGAAEGEELPPVA